MRRHLTALTSAAVLLLPTANAVGATVASPPKKKIVTTWKQALGPLVQVDRWGYIKVLLVVRKKTTTVGAKKTIARRITAVRVPVYPNTGASHTIHLNRLVIPQLAQQVLTAQLNTKIQLISEATDTSVAFDESLQAALLKARRV
jgi:hypothetical protein